MSSDLKLSASCICERIKLTLRGLPSFSYLCHCLRCRKATGSLFKTQVVYGRSQVDISDPDACLSRLANPESSRSEQSPGSGPTYAWCSKCGTPIMTEDSEFVVVRYGLLDLESDPVTQKALEGSVGGSHFKPDFEMFCKRKPNWIQGWQVEGADQMDEEERSPWIKRP